MRDRRRGGRRILVFALVLLARLAPAGAAEVIVRGRVLDESGRPLRGATVELAPLLTHYEATLAAWRDEPDREPAARALTDAAGAFVLSAPEPGFWKTVVRAQGMVAAEYRLAPLIDESTLGDLRLVRDAPLAASGARTEGALARGKDVYESSGDWRRLRASARVAIDAAAGPATPLRVVEDDGAGIAGALVCDVELGIPLGLTDAGGTAQMVGAGTAQRSEVLVLAPDGRVGRLTVGAQKVGDGENASTVAMATLPRAATLSGTVVDDRDVKPLAGAWVWTDLRWAGLGKRALSADVLGDAGQVVRSGASGGFEIRVPAAAQVQATAIGHFQRAVRMGDPGGVELPPMAGPMVVRLQPSQSIGGVVVDAAGQPVPGALVVPFAGRSQSLQTRRSITDDTGRFRLGGMGSQSAAKIVALAAGYAPVVEQLDLRAGGRDDLRIVLRRGRVVRGRVTDLDDHPVAKARVRLAETNERDFGFFPPGRSIRSSPPLLTATRGDGVFEMAGVSAGVYDITVDAAGYAITAAPGWEIGAGDGDADLGVIRVGPGVIVEGIVVEGGPDDAPETPLAGATIGVQRDRSFARIDAVPGPEPWSAWLASESSPEERLESDADGRFTLRDVNPSEKLELRASLEGYMPAWAPGVGGPTDKPVRLVLERGGTVRGRVVDENGEAVADASVSGEGLDSSQPSHARGDREGEFRLSPLVPGVWRLTAQAPGYEAIDDAPVEVDVGAGEVEDGVRIVLRELAHGEVEGRVVDEDGAGVPDASIQIDQGRGTRTGAQGQFHLDRVTLGPRQISALGSRRRTATKTIEVREGVNTVELTLEGGVEVSGRVVDQEGNAVAGANIVLRDGSRFRAGGPFAMVRSAGLSALTDGSGAFRVESVHDGAYTVEATLEAQGRGRLPGELQIQGTPIAGLEIVIEKGAVIRGALRGLDFDQLSQVTIIAAKASDVAPGRVIAAEYEIANLDAGAWRVTGDVPDHGLHAEGHLELEAGQETRLDLDFEGGFTLSGIVTRRGQPAVASSVRLEGLDVAVRRTAKADHEGRYVLRGLDEGFYELQATSSPGRGSRAPWVRHLELREDTEIAIELGGASVSGLVVDADTGDALPGADVQLRFAGPDATGFGGGDSRRTGAAGDFAYDDVPEGAFTIDATKEGYATASHRLELRADSEVEAVVLELSRSAGLRLRVAGELGLVPYLQVMVFDRGGRPAAFPMGLRPDKVSGLFEASGIADGSWSVLVGSGGLGSVWLDVEVPGPVRDVTLQRAARIAVEVPQLVGTSALANLEVFDAAGRPFPTMGGNQYSMLWRVEAGRGTVEGLPAGQWTLRARTLDGKVWTGTAATAPGATALARLQ